MTDAHEVVAAYWAAAEARDWDAFGALLAEDVIYRGPQTREQVRGRDAYRSAQNLSNGAMTSDRGIAALTVPLTRSRGRINLGNTQPSGEIA